MENLYLQTDFGLDEKLQLEVRVLAEDPEWEVNPNDFDYSMNIIGRIIIDSVFSNDLFDQVAAFSNGEVRGVANVVYDEAYQEYFVFLTVYSNTVSGDAISFNIWDASTGQIIRATIDGNSSITFYLEARAHNVYSGQQTVILQTNIRFVRIDENGDPVPISEKVKNKYGLQSETKSTEGED